MKRIFYLNVLLVICALTLFPGKGNAGDELHSIGIGMRGAFYNIDDQASQIYVNDHDYYSDVHVGGFGGSIFLLSRMHDRLLFEITLGAIGHVDEQTTYHDREEVDVLAISPLLFGVQFEPVPYRRVRNIMPYLTAGLGPYWISEINVRDDHYSDEVKVKTQIKHGGYLGAGFNFGFTDGFALNFDLKYHMINLDPSHRYSGFEYGVGFTLSWGKFD